MGRGIFVDKQHKPNLFNSYIAKKEHRRWGKNFVLVSSYLDRVADEVRYVCGRESRVVGFNIAQNLTSTVHEERTAVANRIVVFLKLLL